MSDETKRTIAYLCPRCHQLVTAERSLFALMAEPTDVRCTCGGSAVHIELDTRSAMVAVPCAFCGQGHKGIFDARVFRDKPLIVCSCPERGVDCCYIGEEGAVRTAASRLTETWEQLNREPEEGETFQNDIIMHEVLSELKDIAQRGGISCACGSKEWRLQVNFSSVDLICAQCGGALRIPAATADDLEDLCCKSSLLIKGRRD